MTECKLTRRDAIIAAGVIAGVSAQTAPGAQAGPRTTAPASAARGHAFIMPAATGLGDGSSWGNAAALASLPALLASSSVQTVNIRADAGEYLINAALNSLMITSGGSNGGRKVVRGVNADLLPAKAVFRGTRQTTAHTGSADKELRGYDVFKIKADHLEFRDLFLTCNSLGFDLLGARKDIRVIDCSGSYYRFFFSNINSDNGAFQGTLDDFIISGGVHEYLDVGTIALKAASNGLISGLTGRGHGSYFRSSNQTPQGIRLQTLSHDVTIEDCDFDEIYCRDASSGYFNGDAYVDEADCYKLTWRRCRGAGCTDGGFDLKSSDVLVENCISEGNKLNYRLWGSGVIRGCQSITPVVRGGSNPEAHVNLPNSNPGVTADYDMVDFEVLGEGTAPIILANGPQPSILRIKGGNVTRAGSVGAPNAPLLLTSASGKATLEFA